VQKTSTFDKTHGLLTGISGTFPIASVPAPTKGPWHQRGGQKEKSRYVRDFSGLVSLISELAWSCQAILETRRDNSAVLHGAQAPVLLLTAPIKAINRGLELVASSKLFEQTMSERASTFDEQSNDDDTVTFGAFRLSLTARLLTQNGAPVPLGGRAVDVLATLVTRAGTIVSKRDLFDQVWHGAVVEESNLRFHIAAIRRALGDRKADPKYIVNVARRGYSFVADIHRAEPSKYTSQGNAIRDCFRPPIPLIRIIGRDSIIRSIAATLRERRFVTITGCGGVGKTAVALAAANALCSCYREGVLFVDLAPLADSELVIVHIARLLGLPAGESPSLHSLIAHLRGYNLLLVLDNCEHVVAAITSVAEALLQNCPELNVLATSREAMRGAGEWVERLAPLAVPATDRPSAVEALRYPAVELLVERICACAGSFVLTDGLAPVAADICRHLDGLPLALELAATRFAAFGLYQLRMQLEDRFQWLTKGRRSALPRHRNLNAMIDWSYETLSPEEKAVWQRLSVFSGIFDADATVALCPELGGRSTVALDMLDRLADKSMLTTDLRGGGYHMLETLRLYATDRLKESGELPATKRRHDDYFYRLYQVDTDDFNALDLRGAAEMTLRLKKERRVRLHNYDQSRG